MTAQSMGYSSCPMDGFDFEAVAKLINLPSDHCVCMFVVVGKGVQDAWPRPGQIDFEEAVIFDRFS